MFVYKQKFVTLLRRKTMFMYCHERPLEYKMWINLYGRESKERVKQFILRRNTGIKNNEVFLQKRNI